MNAGRRSHTRVAQERLFSNLFFSIICTSVTGMMDCVGEGREREKSRSGLRKSGDSLMHLRPIEVLQRNARSGSQSSGALTRSAGTSHNDCLLAPPHLLRPFAISENIIGGRKQEFQPLIKSRLPLFNMQLMRHCRRKDIRWETLSSCKSRCVEMRTNCCLFLWGENVP